MKVLLIFLTFILLSIQTMAQSYYIQPFDIGVNATSLISKVISAADDSKDNPIGIYLRKKNDISGIYLGLAALSSKEDFFENNLSLSITTNIFFGRIGIEKYKNLSAKFNVGYGLALEASTEKEKTDNFSSATFASSSTKNIGFGGGPVLRFEYKINNLISLSTESSLLGKFTQKTTEVVTSKGIDTLKSKGYSISTDIPSQLFINIHF